MSTQFIALTLKNARIGSKLSVSEVVSKLQISGVTVSEKTLYGWEKARSQPDIDTFLFLCSLYNLSPNEFMELGKKLINERITPTTSVIEDAYERAAPDIQKSVRKLLDIPEEDLLKECRAG